MKVDNPRLFNKYLVIWALITIVSLVIFFCSPENDTRGALLGFPIISALILWWEYDDYQNPGPFY